MQKDGKGEEFWEVRGGFWVLFLGVFFILIFGRRGGGEGRD